MGHAWQLGSAVGDVDVGVDRGLDPAGSSDPQDPFSSSGSISANEPSRRTSPRSSSSCNCPTRPTAIAASSPSSPSYARDRQHRRHKPPSARSVPVRTALDAPSCRGRRLSLRCPAYRHVKRPRGRWGSHSAAQNYLRCAPQAQGLRMPRHRPSSCTGARSDSPEWPSAGYRSTARGALDGGAGVPRARTLNARRAATGCVATVPIGDTALHELTPRPNRATHGGGAELVLDTVATTSACRIWSHRAALGLVVFPSSPP